MVEQIQLAAPSSSAPQNARPPSFASTKSSENLRTTDGTPTFEYPPTALGTRAPSVETETDRTGLSGATDNKEAFDSYPDSGWNAWIQVAASFALFATTVGGVYSWGVFQDALVAQGLAPSSTLAFIGSLQATMQAVFAIPIARLVRAYGPRRVAVAGAIFTGVGPIAAGWCTHNFAALLITEGLLFGLGEALCFFSIATLPSQYFLRRRNQATGLVYAGSGIGGAVFAVCTDQLLKRVSLPWTFRIIGFVMLAINLPAALTLKARAAKQPFRGETKTQIKTFDVSLFKDTRFNLLLVGTATALFPLFVPPFFLPQYGTSVGLSTTTSSLLLAMYNLSSAAGRIGFGFGADTILGSLNSLSICLLLVGLSTLLIWPFATSIGPLVVFAIINGFCAGGMFSLIPGTLSSIFGTRRLSVIFSMLLTSWTFGYFGGAPIAGYLLQAYGGPDQGAGPYRPAIFYAGSLSLGSAGCVVAVRLLQSKQLWKKV